MVRRSTKKRGGLGLAREAAVRVEGLRHRREGLCGAGPSAGALHGVLLAAGLVLSLAGPACAEALARVRGLLAPKLRR